MLEWDDAKRRANRAKHGVDFAAAEDFEWESAQTREDRRSAHGERRFVSTGWIAGRLHVCVWTPRMGRIRVISLRKANPRERGRYGRTQDLH